jgi:hypothetical protein
MLRAEQNPEERPGLVEGPTRYKTFVNRFEARCGVCGEQYFVNGSVHAAIVTAAEEGLDNPFRCADCDEEYDELAYEG